MSFRNVVPITARRAAERASIAFATASASTAYWESSTSCLSRCICRCIEVTMVFIGSGLQAFTSRSSTRRVFEWHSTLACPRHALPRGQAQSGSEQSQRAAHPVHEVEQGLRDDAEEDRDGAGEDGHERDLRLERGGIHL